MPKDTLIRWSLPEQEEGKCPLVTSSQYPTATLMKTVNCLQPPPREFLCTRTGRRGHGGKKGSSTNTQTDIEQDPYHSGSFVVDYKTLLQEGMSNVVKITT